MAASPLPVPAQPACPETSDSSFCRSQRQFEALDRVRQRIVNAARRAGAEEPSGLIVLLRDAAGTLTIRKVNLELPERVDARLNGYLTPLVMEHMDDPPSTMILELSPAGNRARPHPDSASREPVVRNSQRISEQLDRMAERLSELASRRREALAGRDSIRILYEVLVDSSGRVRQVETHVSSGIRWVDEYFAQLMARLEVAPRVEFGVPRASRMLQPLRLAVK